MDVRLSAFADSRLPDHAELLNRVLISIRDAVGQDDGAR
jgi:hypothetical protein